MNTINRRKFLRLTGSGIIGLTFGSTALRAVAQEKIALDDPTAKALQYVHESQVEGKLCANCMHIKGTEGEDWRPCALFPGKLVSNKGWCAGWMKQPS